MIVNLQKILKPNYLHFSFRETVSLVLVAGAIVMFTIIMTGEWLLLPSYATVMTTQSLSSSSNLTNIPTGYNLTSDDISEFVSIFNDQPFQGGQISPRIVKWVNDDVFIFIQFDKADPSNATAINYIGIGKGGVFCESDRPSKDFVHFHKWNSTSYREGHGHSAGDEGYWLMWVATDEFDTQNRHVMPGVDREFSPLTAPTC